MRNNKKISDVGYLETRWRDTNHKDVSYDPLLHNCEDHSLLDFISVVHDVVHFIYNFIVQTKTNATLGLASQVDLLFKPTLTPCLVFIGGVITHHFQDQ